jgi:hypothetical protein
VYINPDEERSGTGLDRCHAPASCMRPTLAADRLKSRTQEVYKRHVVPVLSNVFLSKTALNLETIPRAVKIASRSR